MKSLCLLFVLHFVASTPTLAQDPMPISEVRKLPFGTTVSKVAGRVSASKVFRNTAYIQDATGGIAVFNSIFINNVTIGDSVVIENAELVDFQPLPGQPGTGLTELAGPDLRFTVIPVERVVPSPRTLTIPIIGEGVEGQLVRIRRVRFADAGKAFQAESNYTVFDIQGNDFAIRIDGATNIATNSLTIPDGEVDVIGCVAGFRGGYQMFPRFAEDVGLAPVEADTVKKWRTLDVTSWNLEWFGSTDTTQGPRDKNRQRRSIRQVMDSVQADIYALQEVLTEEAARSLADSIQGEYAVLFTSEIPSDQKMCYIYNTQTITPVSSGLAVNGGSQAWANGRFPYRFTFDAKVDGKIKRYVVFNIHAKATGQGTEQADYQRRKADAETFHQYLKDFYSDSAVLVVGDYNDVFTMSVVDSSLPSPYKVFLDDTERWFSPTLALEQRNLASFIGFNRTFIDHCLISTDLNSSFYRTYLEAPQAYLSSYSSTVSDHLPVTTRLYVDGVVSVEQSNAPTAFSVRIAPLPLVTHGTAEITIQQPGNVKAALVDMNGIEHVLYEGYAEPQLMVLNLPTQNMATGLYTLIVTANDRSVSKPVVMIR